MPAGDIYQISIDQTLFGVSLMNSIHLRQIDADTDPDMGVGAIAAWVNNIEATWLATVSNDLTINQYRAIRVHPIPSQSVVVGISVVGTRVAEALPANMSGLISMSAAPASAPHIVKTFLAGLIEDDIVDGVWDAAARSLMEVLADAILAILLSPGGTSFERVAWQAATSTARKVLVREVRSSSRKLRSRTKT